MVGSVIFLSAEERMLFFADIWRLWAVEDLRGESFGVNSTLKDLGGRGGSAADSIAVEVIF